MKSRFSRLIDHIDGAASEEDSNKVSQGISDLIEDMRNYKKLYKTAFIISPITGIVISSWICQLWDKMVGKQDYIYLSHLLTGWLNPIGAILMVVLTVFTSAVFYRIHKITKKDYYVDREGNFLVSKSGIHGTAHWQTEKEREACFERSTDIHDLLGDVLGKDDEGRLYTLRKDLVGINRNKCVFGVPGSGKSAAIIENDILQCMRRGESAIITDSKGDLYRKLSQKARDNGYCVRVLNLKPTELRNSDGFDLMKYFADGDISSTAEVLARSIIENTRDPYDRNGMDYWAINEMNGYKSLLLYIATNETLKKAGRCNLAEMYNMATQNDSVKLATLFNGLPATNEARQAFNIYANCEPRVQGQILNGMGIKLSFLINDYAKKIVSSNEIDLVAPMKKKCMYFVVISDTNKAYNVIANLFFNMMLIKQCEYSDSLTTQQKKDQLFVNYILDEFKATGSINNFDGTITTVRSRKICFTTVLQTLGQLKDMYPGEAYNTILGSMTIKMLLRSGDTDTSQFFTDACGKQTRVEKGAKYSDTVAEAVHVHNGQTITESSSGEDLLPLDETQKMDANRLVVMILGFQPVKLYKYLSNTNPFMDGWEDHEKVPGKHKPKWRKLDEQKAAEQRARIDAENAGLQPASSESGTIQPEGYEQPFDPETGEIKPAAPGLPESNSETPQPVPKKRGRFKECSPEQTEQNNNAMSRF